MVFWLSVALAQDLLGDPVVVPARVRVEVPDYPGAVGSSATASVLMEPPPPGVPWSWEPEIHLDGWPSTLAVGALGAERWHAAGHRGQGVKVAVVDLQFYGADRGGDTLAAAGTADCVAHRSCEVPIDPIYTRFAFEQGPHGFACAEVVRSVAPEAELYLVRVNATPTFENAVDWAIRHEIDVLSMSMSFFNGSFYDGGGAFGPAIRRLEEAGILLVTSAGNSAQQHWAGPWRDVDGDGRFDFDGDNGLDVELNGGGRRALYINWDEHRSCGSSDLGVRMLSPDGFVVGRQDAVQDDDGETCDPVERINALAESSGIYRLEVYANRVARTDLWVDVFTTTGRIVGADPGGSIVDPGVHAGAFTVGAVRARGYLTNPVQGFSSQGPVRTGAPKPDIAGPDGLEATAYGAENFFGTSAATPAVAGAVAVVMSSEPGMSGREAASKLQAWAWRDGADGHDPGLGAGRARLPLPDPSRGGCGRGMLLAGLVVLPWRRIGRRGVPADRGGRNRGFRHDA